jgi:hypothetical protein
MDTLQHDDRDLPASDCLELGERRHERYLFRPDPLALRTLREPSYDQNSFRAHLDRGPRIRHQIAIPHRMARTATVGCEDGEAIADRLFVPAYGPVPLPDRLTEHRAACGLV